MDVDGVRELSQVCVRQWVDEYKELLKARETNGIKRLEKQAREGIVGTMSVAVLNLTADELIEKVRNNERKGLYAPNKRKETLHRATQQTVRERFSTRLW